MANTRNLHERLHGEHEAPHWTSEQLVRGIAGAAYDAPLRRQDLPNSISIIGGLFTLERQLRNVASTDKQQRQHARVVFAPTKTSLKPSEIIVGEQNGLNLRNVQPVTKRTEPTFFTQSPSIDDLFLRSLDLNKFLHELLGGLSAEVAPRAITMYTFMLRESFFSPRVLGRLLNEKAEQALMMITPGYTYLALRTTKTPVLQAAERTEYIEAIESKMREARAAFTDEVTQEIPGHLQASFDQAIWRAVVEFSVQMGIVFYHHAGDGQLRRMRVAAATLEDAKR